MFHLMFSGLTLGQRNNRVFYTEMNCDVIDECVGANKSRVIPWDQEACLAQSNAL